MVFYEARWFLPVSSLPVEGGGCVVRDGKILAVGKASDLKSAWPDVRHVDLGDTVLSAAPINAHTHLELSWIGDHTLPRGNFIEWLEAFVQLRDRKYDADLAWEAAEAALETMLARGTAAIGEVHNGVWTPGILASSPIEIVGFHELYGFPAALAERLLAEAAGRLDAMHTDADVAAAGDRIQLAPTPHAAYSTSAPLIKALAGRAAAAGAPLSIHVAESEEEVRLLQHGDGPLRDFLIGRDAWDPAWTAPGTTPLETIDRIGALGSRTLVVHAVHLTHEDISRIQTRGATVVTCPRSNEQLGVGTCPVTKLLHGGVPVALGTDSLASAPDLDLFAELAALRRCHPDLAPAAAWRIATLGGAHALQLEDRLGTLEEGKLARMVCVPLAASGDNPFETLTNAPKDVQPLGFGDAEEDGDEEP